MPKLHPLHLLARLGLAAAALAALGPAVPALAQQAAAAVDPALLAGLEARSIGPAVMSGRVVSLAGVPGDPPVLYVGAASGGLWRSSDGGVVWEPLFDEQPVASVGAIAVDPTAPDVVWVGTGEATPRNSASVGNGVYRSMDGGETWSHLGLERTEKIAKVLLDPRATETAYACALGTSWGETEERGVFKTTDGGRTWEKVLYVDPRTGCADLAMDPSNPNKLFAAMWDHRRWPWFFRSGGPGSGLHVTHDGGRSWRELTPEDGLPEGDLGRIGVAVAPSEPDRVYALVEAEENALYVSNDGGRTFSQASTDELIGNRPFYYSQLRVDPADANRVYSLWSQVSVSKDGGASWETLIPFRQAHPDHHAMWIDPTNPHFVVEGNDGGVYLSRDRGITWSFVESLPFAQYYHVRVDDAVPYHVYGGLQDNGSWKGPSEVWEAGGIRNHHWHEVGFGDGFDTAPFPDDDMQGYSMSQEGYLSRWNLRTGGRRDIRPAAPAPPEPPEEAPAPLSAPAPPEDELRFNWNAAFAQDPFDPATIYFGSQYVHRSSDRGESWEVISPDLTTDRAEWQRQGESGGLTLDVTGAENFTSILAIEPSPLERGLLWVGTDDGRLHLSRDGGATWTALEDRVRGVPANTWIPHVHASRHDAGTAFVVFDNHRRFDWTPYVYRTTDYGRTWQNLAGEDLWGYALSVVQDPVDPDLLFVGTEFGLWTSLDGGASWFRWTHGVPTVSVMDLAIQEREGDLVLGTHGRGIFVLDDLSPLRDLTAGTLGRPLHLFPVPDAWQHEVGQGSGARFPGADEYRGENAPYGALITFSLDQEGLPHPDDAVERERKAAEREAKRREAAEAEAERAIAPSEETPPEVEAEPEPEPGAEEEAGEEEPARGRGRRGRGPMAEIEIADASGEVIRTMEEPVALGINRVAWDLRRDGFERPKTDEEEPWWGRGGPEVPAGAYSVTVRYGGEEASAPVTVLPDPRREVPEGARAEKYTAILEAGALQERLTAAIERLRDTRRDVEFLQAKAARDDDDEDGAEDGEDPRAEVREAAGDLLERLDALEEALWGDQDAKGIPPETDAWNDVSYALRSLNSSWDAPTPTQRRHLERARRSVERALAPVERFFAEELPAFKAKVDAAALTLLARE